MMFRYQARDPLGKLHDGRVSANSPEDATQTLRGDGFQVLQLDEDQAEWNLMPRPIRRSEVIYVTSQLAIMVDTGINLAAALEGVAEQEPNPSLKRILDELRQRVEAGEDFSSALARFPKQFDRTFIALVKAAEHSGSLGPMLERIAGYQRDELEARGKIRASMAYPCVMFVLAIAVTLFLLTYVLPKFTPLFLRKGVELPRPTVIMMSVSDVLLVYWYAWLALAAALVVLFLVARKTPGGRSVLDGIKLNLPLLGGLSRKINISRSIRTLGTMIQSGVSMLDALQLSADVAHNIHFERSWHRVLDAVTQGHRISDTLFEDPLFPRTLVQMIRSGEETGRLDEVLQKVSRYYDGEVETSLKTVTSLIEPLMIAVMGVVVGGIGLSLLLPIFSLSRMPG